MSKSVDPTGPVKSDKDYEAENAADTMVRYHEIRSNPELMTRVKKHAGRRVKALSGLHNDIKSIDDLKAVRNKKFGPQKKCASCGKTMKMGECEECDKMGDM